MQGWLSAGRPKLLLPGGPVGETVALRNGTGSGTGWAMSRTMAGGTRLE